MTKPLELGALVLGKLDATDLRTVSRECEQWGYDYLWVADERFFRDVYAALTICALETSKIKLGPGVTDPYSRHPALTAMGIATIDEVSGGRAVLGIGAGVAGFAELGITLRKPARALRESVEFIRAFMSNEPTSYEGEIVTFSDGVLNVPGVPDLPVYIAGKGPLNIRLAGEIADGLIISSCVHDATIDHTRKLLNQGAEKGNRDGAEVTICSRVNISISEDADAAREAVKPMIAALIVSKKDDLSFLEPLGLGLSSELAQLVAETTYGHDRATMGRIADLLTDDFVDALALAGSVNDVADGLQRMHQRGVGQIIAYPMPVSGDSVTDVLRRLAVDVQPLVHQ